MREGFFEKYIKHPGIDIGCGRDIVHPAFKGWDIMHGDGDAAEMKGVPAGHYSTVYSSHLLEHMRDPVSVLRRWYELLAPGGLLIVMVPHRDLYERKITLPSTWNDDHKWFWHPDVGDGNDTLGLRETVMKAAPDAILVSLRVLDEGWIPLPPEQHATGEYSIEIIVRRPEAHVADAS